MNDEFEALEKRLKKLVPAEQEALAAEILGHRQRMDRDNAALPASSPRRRRFASFSISSAIVGAMLGAAATFLAMTLLVPPKIEIREVAHVEPGSNMNSPHVSAPAGSENSLSAEPIVKKALDDRLARSVPPFGELDALLAEQEARARRLARYESNFNFASSGFAPPRISPEQYREILRDLKL
jgi:hypothetical protein